jgi:hypothetical protein
MSAHSKNPDAIDLTMRGWALTWHASQTPSKDNYDASTFLPMQPTATAK